MAALELPPGRLERVWLGICHRDVLSRMALAFAAAAAVCIIIQAWDSPLHWHTGRVTPRAIPARVDFQRGKTGRNRAEKAMAARITAIFIQDIKPLEQLRADLRNTIAELTKTDTLTDKTAPIWQEFYPSQPPQPQPPPDGGAKTPALQSDLAAFQEFRKAMAGKENLDRLDRAVAETFAPFEHRGLLVDLTKNLEGYNKKTIMVYPAGHPDDLREVEVRYVTPDPKEIRQTLIDGLGSKGGAGRVYSWLEPRLLQASKLSTFTLDVKASQAAQEEENAAKVEPVVVPHERDKPLVASRESIDKSKLDLLELERAAYLAKRTLPERASRCAAVLLVVFALFTLCGMYMRYRQRGIQAGLDRLAGALGLAVGTVFLAVAVDPYRAELAAVILFGMIVAIAYRQELALLFSGVVCWIVVLALGGDLPMFLLLFGTTAAAALNLGRIRTRTKLIYVGLFAGCVAALLDLAMKLIDNQPLNWSRCSFARRATSSSGRPLAGFIHDLGLLYPFVERLFGVLTDLSLLELGDITHPLLQELVRRAPSTYNHSITVGSIAEAAADAIGARGLICRIGAYFHDIGKMLKPGYFVENQGKEGNRHDGLVPAMSTLVIIAHIKDGADLARQHHLPQPIIDMIEQHHGTMLMEYFLDRAHTQQASDPNGSEIDENLFRYPGPKPQSKEAAVLMLADAVESASRTLVDPTPGRIEGLVGDLAQRRLQAGQFDESGLTLRELGTIERSLAMSVASIYHGRLKYPEQRTA